jgi:hypothetical protein
VRAVDPRLLPLLHEITRHPEWAPGPPTDLDAHRAVATFDHLCVEVLRPGATPLFVTVNVERAPWTVQSIVIFDPATDEEPRVTHDEEEGAGEADLCRHVLAGSDAPFPADPELVEVNGPIHDPAHARAIARALVERPERFGLDRSSRPAINLDSPLSPVPDGTFCYPAVVYQGGPARR